MSILQSFVETLPFPDISVDFKDFSEKIKLYDYQQMALQNIAKLLYYYYQEIKENKEKLWMEYIKRGFNKNLEIENGKILMQHFKEDELGYKTFVNRACFWMATGSGKTLVIIKLIELLDQLMNEGIIPQRDILFLTHRDDLILSFRKHVEEYNKGRDRRIILEELKNYNFRKVNPTLYDRQNILVFYYRSDLISDEKGDKRLDYRYFHNNGNWYLILDEAHKGDNEESKRKQIFLVFTKNGFMFNFSASFTDEFDRASTVYRFNLADFVAQGYGKHIMIMETQTTAFRKKEEEFTEEEKKEIVAKLLILTSFLRFLKDRRYPSPLALVLVNTVNTKDSDLKLFFRELFRIAEKGLQNDEFLRLKNELLSELKEISFWYEGGKLREEEINKLSDFTLKDFYINFFLSEGPSEVEIIYHPQNRQEILFKLRGGDSPFALVRIGDVVNWLKSLSSDFVVHETFEKEEYFLSIDKRESISLLAGSRSFYEGWDSPRPNVISFINIGRREAQKFVLQSIGRGVRIRIKENGSEHTTRQDFIRCLETLYVFATSRKSVLSVVNETLKIESEKEWEVLRGIKKNPLIEKKTLLIPFYKYSESRTLRNRVKFYVGKEDLKEAIALVKNINREDVLCFLTGHSLKTIAELKKVLTDPGDVIHISGHRKYKDPVILLRRLGDFLNVKVHEVEGFEDVDDKIKHYRRIEVDIKSLGVAKKESLERIISANLDISNYEGISIEWLEKHFYLPLLRGSDGISPKVLNWIKHIVKHESEIAFIKELKENSSCLKQFDWWAFSRIDESIDKEFYIPYYKNGRKCLWYPDFLLWLQRGYDYFIVFVDPKGSTHADYQFKLDYAKLLFENSDGTRKVFYSNGKKIRVYTLLYLKDVTQLPEGYERYWIRSVEELCRKLRD